MPRKVESWETVDGERFKTIEEAERHEARLELETLCGLELVGGEITPNHVATFLIEQAERIAPLLLTFVDDMWLDERCEG